MDSSQPAHSVRDANRSAGLSRGLLTLLAASLFAVAATIHYQTPMLAAIGADFRADAAAVGWVATLTFGGFLAGIILLVPLGDRFDKRRLILVEIVLLVVALLAMAAAPSLALLAAAGFVVGVCASLGQIIVPLAVELAPAHARGRIMGTLLTALFLGILFGRIAGGLIASQFGWRWTYVFAALIIIALAPALVARLPRTSPKTGLDYRALLWSLVGLLRAHADLRRIAAIQFLLGISYGGFWATAATMLATFHGLGPTATGLMAIPGAAGILVARPAGRWMDRSGVTPVVTTGICLVFAAYAAFGFAALSLGAVIAGAMLMDFGLRAAMVANQTLVNTAVPEARSRGNTIFGGFVWSGNAAGAFLASMALAHFGWPAVCAIALTASGAALAVQLRGSASR